jgi:signal transduction histidine kinase
MFDWLNTKLAVRQTSYALVAILVVGSIFAFAVIVQLYANERDRIDSTLNLQLEMAATAAARATYHVDETQAKVILEGLFRFKDLEWARISTNLNEVLAERNRTAPTSVLDNLSNFLFDDITSNHLRLDIPEIDRSDRATKSQNRESEYFGIIELRASSELIGRDFFRRTAAFVIVLVFQCLLLGVTLMVIFHRTLTLPLLRYANDVAHVGTSGIERPVLRVPEAHRRNELGTVVIRTNELLEQIQIQNQNILHREKIATLGSLLAGVSHELNNPLAILKVQSELLIETADGPKDKERGEKILAIANRCAGIVRRFLDLARRREVEREPLDIDILITEVLGIIGLQLDNAGIKVDHNTTENLPQAFADSSQITQVLLNLIVNSKNALASVEGNRQISVDVGINTNSEMIQISVSDNGPGITADIRNRIFEPFFTTNMDGPGTGLGLSYSYEVAQNHGGNLICATNISCGATFILTLPAVISADDKNSDLSVQRS